MPAESATRSFDVVLYGATGFTGRQAAATFAERVDVAVACTGTLTLELTALGVPMVAVYKVHPVTWSVGRRVVRGVDHLALPNILAGRGIVPEHLQDLSPWHIAQDALTLLGDAGEVQRRALAEVRGQLGSGAMARAADAVIEVAARSQADA